MMRKSCWRNCICPRCLHPSGACTHARWSPALPSPRAAAPSSRRQSRGRPCRDILRKCLDRDESKRPNSTEMLRMIREWASQPRGLGAADSPVSPGDRAAVSGSVGTDTPRTTSVDTTVRMSVKSDDADPVDAPEGDLDTGDVKVECPGGDAVLTVVQPSTDPAYKIAGPIESLAASEIAEVGRRTVRALGDLAALGTAVVQYIDLGGRTEVVDAPIPVTAADLTVANGTLRAGDAAAREGVVLRIGAGATVRLQAVTVEGGGVCVSAGGSVKLDGVAVMHAPGCGVRCEGGRAEVEGGRIVGARMGVCCEGGGRAALRDAVIRDSTECGMVCRGKGSELSAVGGCVEGTRESHGAMAEEGGCLTLTRVDVLDARDCGVWSSGQGSKATVDSGRIERARGACGVGCEGGGTVKTQSVDVASSGGAGAQCSGIGSRLAMRGGSVVAGQTGVAALLGGAVEMEGVEVRGVATDGVVVRGAGSKAEIGGGSVAGCKEGHGVRCGDGGAVSVRGMRIEACKGHAVWAEGAWSVATVSGVEARGCQRPALFKSGGASLRKGGRGAGAFTSRLQRLLLCRGADTRQ